MRPWLYYRGPAVLWAGLVLFLSLSPDTSGPDMGWDKANHFAAYAVLSFLVTRALSAGGRVSVRAAAAAISAAFLFGIMVEFLQSLTETRSMEALDAVANGLGAAAGAVVLSLIKNRTEVKGCL